MRSNIALLSFAFYAASALAQPTTNTFSSGSTGADGALTYAPSLGLVYFPPAGLTPHANNIYNFTTITIGTGTTVRLSGWVINGPVYWLAQGAVTISGTLDLSGTAGYLAGTPSLRAPNEPGAGGYSGGLGHTAVSGQNATAGSGPGGGQAPGYDSNNSDYGGGATYSGSSYLQPLIGGSGGGGGCKLTTTSACGGGGAGGGAILIASSTVITVGGIINAGGGYGNGNSYGGGGSGGAIRLVSNTLNVAAGPISALGNTGAGGGSHNGAPGLIRLEGFTVNSSGGIFGGTVITSTPLNLSLPVGGPSTVSVTSINGTAINANPFSFPDIALNTSSAVPVVISGVNIPPGTTGNLYIFGETTADQTIPFTLTGTLQATTATVNVTYPSVGSRGFAKVTWTGQ